MLGRVGLVDLDLGSRMVDKNFGLIWNEMKWNAIWQYALDYTIPYIIKYNVKVNGIYKCPPFVAWMLEGHHRRFRRMAEETTNEQVRRSKKLKLWFQATCFCRQTRHGALTCNNWSLEVWYETYETLVQLLNEANILEKHRTTVKISNQKNVCIHIVHLRWGPHKTRSCWMFGLLKASFNGSSPWPARSLRNRSEQHSCSVQVSCGNFFLLKNLVSFHGKSMQIPSNPINPFWIVWRP